MIHEIEKLISMYEEDEIESKLELAYCIKDIIDSIIAEEE